MSKSAKKVATTAEENLAKLTPKQQLYLENRIQGMSQKASATAAGYSGGSSSMDLENHPRIKFLMHEATKQAFKKISVTRHDVVAGFMDAVNMADSSTELVMAWRELGKIIGAYEPEVKVIAHVDVTAEKVRNMKDEDLLKMAEIETYLNPVMEADIVEAEYSEVVENPSIEDENFDIFPERVDEHADIKADIDEDLDLSTEYPGLGTEDPDLSAEGDADV